MMADHDLPTDIRIVTLNCWGLKYIAKQRTQRIAEIAHRLAVADPAPDIVALQECFVHDDYLTIRRATRKILPHGKFYFAGAFGAGLAILARWPLDDAATLPYPLNGRPTAFWRGDWYVGKGVACATLRYGPSPDHRIHVFNTHTHAPYDDTYTLHRLAQSWFLASLLRRAAAAGELVVALGDFNMRPATLHHRLLTARAPVRDAWRLLHPDSALGTPADPLERARRRPVPGALHNLLENGATSDSAYSTWRWPPREQRRLADPSRLARVVAPDAPDTTGKRLDYIFFSAPDASRPAGAPAWTVSAAAVGMRDPHPHLRCSLSDHFSVEATLTLHAPDPAAPSPLDAQLPRSGAADDACPAAARDAAPLTDAEYAVLLAEIAAYRARERAQRRRRAATALALLAAWLAALLAVWFVPPRARYGPFLLLLAGSLALAAAVVDGLLALLFFPAELRALHEFEWDVLNARAAAAGTPGPGLLSDDAELDRIDDKI